MSREWGLHCKTCDSHSVNDFNHGENLLRSMIRAYPHIEAARQADTSGYLEISIMGYGYCSGDLFEWMDKHIQHDIELEDEYGNAEPLEEVSKG